MSDDLAFSLGLAIIFLIAAVASWDYWRAKTGQMTISQFAKGYATRPYVLLFAGLFIGFSVGSLTGFILGHLFWGQKLE